MATDQKKTDRLLEFRPDKAVPYSVEAEQAVLGGILLNPKEIATAVAALVPDSFYVTRHRDIFETMVEISDDSLAVEGLVLLERLRNKGIFKTEEDKTYLLSLADAASRISDIRYFVNIVREKYLLRKIIETCADVADRSYDNEAPESVLDLAQSRFSSLQNGDAGKDFQSLQSLVKNEIQRLNEMQQDETGKFEPLKTGIGTFDNIYGGLNNGNLVILAARPGVGKTSFALNIGYNVATSQRYAPKKSVVFFSLEMSNEEIARRLISIALRIDSEKLRLGKISEREWEEMYDFRRNTLAGSNLVCCENSAITVAEMKGKLRSVKNLGLVIIDYLQLMGSGNNPNRVQEISDLTRSLKLMAKELGVPLLLLSQLSRAVTKREDPTPQLADLRDSGSIEQDADVVIFLDRPETRSPDAKRRGVCDVFVQKNRHGQTGKFTLAWDGKHTAFNGIEQDLDVPEDEGIV